MSTKGNKENKEEEPQNKDILNTKTKKESLITLVGNKRIRSDTEEKIEIKKICKYCNKIPTYEVLEYDDSTPKKNIINFISKQIKDENFIKLLTEIINKKIINQDKKNNIICDNCFKNAFINGGLDKVLNSQKAALNPFQESEDKKNNLKKIIDLYSVNLSIAINNLKELKAKYSKTVKNTKDLFNITALQVMLSNNKDPFQDLKKKMDNCEKNLKEIEDNFESLINDLSSKEELKMFYIEGLNNNDDSSKNNLLKILKSIQNEIELSSFNINGALPNSYNGNERNLDNTDYLYSNLNIKTNNNNNSLLNNANIQNNNNSSQILNLQAQKKLNEQETLASNIEKNIQKSNLLSALSKSNIIQNGLGMILPPFNISQARIPNNILINNILNSSNLNPQLFSQISNINQIGPILTNNSNLNDNNKTINNILLSGINSPFLQRPNLFNSPIDAAKELEIMTLRNLLNNNNSQNNLINNLYNNQINPILSSNTFNNYNSSLSNNILNLQGSNGFSLNNNNLGGNEINQLNLINREKMNANLNNNNKQGVNLNYMNNLNNMNINNANNINNLTGLNGLSNSININDINNSNLNKEILNQNLNNNTLQGQQPPNEIGKEKLVQLFNNVFREKYQKNLDNKVNNTHLNNNQIDLNSASSIQFDQNYLQQMNPYSPDIKANPLNIIDNNINSINLGKLENNNNMLQNNLNSKSESNIINNDIEKIKK